MKLLETKPIPTEKLVKSSKNPRRRFVIDDLLPNIKEHGIKKALMVVEVDGKYEVIDGERRRLCAVELGLKNISCEICDMTDDEQWYWAYTLNELDQPLDAMSRAWALYTRKKALGLTNEQLGKKYPMRENGKDDVSPLSKTHVKDLVRLVILPENIQSKVENGYSIGKAIVLNQLAFDIRWDTKLNDFNFDAEPEDWKEKRTTFQEYLAGENWTVEAIRKRVNQYITEEQRRRDIIEAQELARDQRIKQYEKDLKQKHDKITKNLKTLKEAGINWSPSETLTVFDERISRAIKQLKEQRPDAKKLTQYEMTWMNLNDLKNKILGDDTDVCYEDGYRCNHCSRTITEEEVEELITSWQQVRDGLREQKNKVDGAIRTLQDYSREVKRLVNGIKTVEKDLKELEKE